MAWDSLLGLRTIPRRWSRCISSARPSLAAINDALPALPATPPQPPRPPPIESRSSINEDLDDHLVATASRLLGQRYATPLHRLYEQYRSRAGYVLTDVLEYEGNPASHRRADRSHLNVDSKDGMGDGTVLVVHFHQSLDGGVQKMTVCSGFAIVVKSDKQADTDVIVTCAHTLEEIQRHAQHNLSPGPSVSFILPGTGSSPRPITRILSSTPRSDLLILECARQTSQPPIRTLPVSPFPVAIGHPVLTHLFGAPDAPLVSRSKMRVPAGSPPPAIPSHEEVETPVGWLGGRGWRRWGKGNMLGYRSYVGQEVEAGTSSPLPYILTSVLPTSGSSGGPLVDAETGTVVGMISGRRMDSRVEGERGWGSAAEQIYEMFALPGFTPASSKRTT